MKLTRKEGAVDAAAGAANDDEVGRERVVRCAACGALVAKERARVLRNGAHEHDFMNPAGIRFVVQCFDAAPGCAPVGVRSTVWSFFPGWGWQIEICRACGEHLGWSFHREGADAGAFYGLIKDRLA